MKVGRYRVYAYTTKKREIPHFRTSAVTGQVIYKEICLGVNLSAEPSIYLVDPVAFHGENVQELLQ